MTRASCNHCSFKEWGPSTRLPLKCPDGEPTQPRYHYYQTVIRQIHIGPHDGKQEEKIWFPCVLIREGRHA